MKALIVLLKILLALLVLLALALGGALLFMPGIHVSSLQMALNVMTGSSADTPSDELMARLQVADGYSINIFARGVENPRLLLATPAGRLLVSSPRTGTVTQLEDSNGDGAADRAVTLLQGLRRPQGLEYAGGYLYVGESHQVGRVSYDAEAGEIRGDYTPIIEGLTDDGNHWSKTLRFGPDGGLYVSMGSTCNVCEEADPRRATIMRFNADGSDGEIFASGLRNSVGMDFAPFDGGLYATDNGRDLLGDDYPPCELNRVERGAFYGWPYLNGANEPDPDYGHLGKELQSRAVPPVFDFRAHNAPLGIHFPAGGERTALVALHGSWNRSEPDGYKVLELQWAEDGSISSRDFVSGFERDADIVGRPVDIASVADGTIYISDDYAGVIYRVSRGESAPAGEAITLQAPRQLAPVEIDPDLATAGAALYAAYPCATCHADEAATPVPLDRLHARYDLQSLADYFLTPTPPMPRYEFSAEEREQLAHYLLSQPAPAAGTSPDRR